MQLGCIFLSAQHSLLTNTLFSQTLTKVDIKKTTIHQKASLSASSLHLDTPKYDPSWKTVSFHLCSLDLTFSSYFCVNRDRPNIYIPFICWKIELFRKTFMPRRLSGHGASSGAGYPGDNPALCEVIDCADDYCKDAIDLTTINRSILLKLTLHHDTHAHARTHRGEQLAHPRDGNAGTQTGSLW